MAYDEDLANRIREALAEETFTEKRMFGGLAFLIGGRMAIAASGQGGILVRVGDEEYEAALGEPGVSEFVMRDRPMRGWARVSGDVDVGQWVARGVAAARALSASESSKRASGSSSAGPKSSRSFRSR